MTVRTWHLVIVITSALLLGGATTLALSVEQLTAEADVVVKVRIQSAEASWVPSSRGQRVITFHEATIIEAIVGELTAGERARTALLVGTLGGVVGEIEQRVPGAPRLFVGQEYLLFVGKPAGPGGARGVIGMWRGAVNAGPRLPAAEATALDDVIRRVRSAVPR